MFIEDKLITPSSGILPGITRQVILDILKDDYEIEVRQVKAEEIENLCNRLDIETTLSEISKEQSDQETEDSNPNLYLATQM